jgi:hypothetical protein
MNRFPRDESEIHRVHIFEIDKDVVSGSSGCHR